MDSFFDYIRTIDTEDPSISNRLKDAVTYALNQEKYLRRFLDDGNIPLDNLEALCEGITYAHLFPESHTNPVFPKKRCA